jgi:hypothetical protein
MTEHTSFFCRVCTSLALCELFRAIHEDVPYIVINDNSNEFMISTDVSDGSFAVAVNGGAFLTMFEDKLLDIFDYCAIRRIFKAGMKLFADRHSYICQASYAWHAKFVADLETRMTPRFW